MLIKLHIQKVNLYSYNDEHFAPWISMLDAHVNETLNAITVSTTNTVIITIISLQENLFSITFKASNGC